MSRNVSGYHPVPTTITHSRAWWKKSRPTIANVTCVRWQLKNSSSLSAAWFIGKLKYRARAGARAIKIIQPRGNVENAWTRTHTHTYVRGEKCTHIKIDTRIRATANFIFSNRDLRLPQASASPFSPPPLRDALQRRITFFLARVFFRSLVPLHPRENLLCRVPAPFWYFKRRKRKKRYLYENVFLRLLPSRLRSTYLPRVFLRARLASRGGCPPRSLGIETRVESDSLSGHFRQTTRSHPTCTCIYVANVYNEASRWLRSNPREPLTNLECQCLSTLPIDGENPDKVVVLRSFERIKRYDRLHRCRRIVVYHSTLRNFRNEDNCFLTDQKETDKRGFPFLSSS